MHSLAFLKDNATLISASADRTLKFWDLRTGRERFTLDGSPKIFTSRRGTMSEAAEILAAIARGDGQAAERLLALVYEELRVLARQKLAQEKPGQTLQATALVHEAYLRLIGSDKPPAWDSRGHFFAAAAEAMRR